MSKLTRPDYIGHRQRIKKKYEKSGMEGWLDYEVLELVLSYAIPRKDTKPIAKELLARFKTLNGVPLHGERYSQKRFAFISSGRLQLFNGLLKGVVR